MADGWAQYGAAPAQYAATAAATVAAARPQVAVVEAKSAGSLPTARLAGPSAGSSWLVRRITVSTPGNASAVRAFIYVGEVAPENLVMGTNSGVFDYTTEDPPLYVPDGMPLIAQWDAGPARALARVEYQEV